MFKSLFSHFHIQITVVMQIYWFSRKEISKQILDSSMIFFVVITRHVQVPGAVLLS